jgi:hypothetical protein
VFWAGATFTLARSGGVGGDQLFYPQMGAAVFSVLTGGYLWSQFQPGGTQETILAIAAVCAILAAAVQGAMAGGALRAFRAARIDQNARVRRIGVSQRIAAALLAVTVVCMGIARYV